MNSSASTETSLRQELVGVHLKRWRENMKLTKIEVARKLKHTNSQQVSSWEKGQSMPPMDVLPKLMLIYGISAEEMLDVVYRYQEQQLAMQRTEMIKLLKIHSRG